MSKNEQYTFTEIKAMRDKEIKRISQKYPTMFSSLNAYFSKKMTMRLSNFLGVVMLLVVAAGFAGITLGMHDERANIARENQESAQNLMEAQLMAGDVQDVWEVFLKFLMVKIMRWLPIIMIFLGVGWVLHGVF